MNGLHMLIGEPTVSVSKWSEWKGWRWWRMRGIGRWF